MKMKIKMEQFHIDMKGIGLVLHMDTNMVNIRGVSVLSTLEQHSNSILEKVSNTEAELEKSVG